MAKSKLSLYDVKISWTTDELWTVKAHNKEEAEAKVEKLRDEDAGLNTDYFESNEVWSVSKVKSKKKHKPN